MPLKNSILDLTFVKKRIEKQDTSGAGDGARADRPSRKLKDIVTLELDSNVASPNPTSAVSLIGQPDFKSEIKAISAFFYGKVWFYNTVLEILLGPNWPTHQSIQVIHYEKGLSTETAGSRTKLKPLVVLPSVHDQISLNMLVSKALKTERPVWFIGYPSTLSKHLLVSFQSFFLCEASPIELEILSDVVQLSKLDLEFLIGPKNGIYISKGNSQSVHLTF